MSAIPNAPVIIKRKKVIAGGGHHGGAWKVAYADFVTAMMAFFMLMWLLNATTETQRKGIADYFNPSVPLIRVSGGGDGSFGGMDVFSEETRLRSGIGGSARVVSDSDRSRGSSGVDDSQAEDAAAEDEILTTMEQMLSGRSGESMVSDDLLRHIVTRVTDEGLIVDLFDLPGEVLFEPGTTQPTDLMGDLLAVVAEVFSLTSNRIAINGHVRSEPIVLRDDPTWALSTGRADVVRELMDKPLIDGDRIERMAGFADSKPMRADRMDIRNNRIELILLREGH